jgi:hypothetical protein
MGFYFEMDFWKIGMRLLAGSDFFAINPPGWEERKMFRRGGSQHSDRIIDDDPLSGSVQLTQFKRAGAGLVRAPENPLFFRCHPPVPPSYCTFASETGLNRFLQSRLKQPESPENDGKSPDEKPLYINTPFLHVIHPEPPKKRQSEPCTGPD